MGLTHKTFHYHLPKDRFFSVAAAAVQQQRFHISNPQPQFDFLNAEFKEVVRVGRDSRNFDIVVEISWQGDQGQTYGSIKVDDRKRQDDAAYAEKIKLSLDQLSEIQIKRIAETGPEMDYGSARWGTTEDLRKANYLASDIHPKRFILAKKDGGYFALTEEDTNKHAFVCGPQGSGKSSGFFIPNILLRSKTSMILTEATAANKPNPDPQLYIDTAGARAESGSKIYTFNPLNMYSTRINPIDAVRLAPPDETTNEAAKIANLMSSNSKTMTSGDAEFWQTSERHLFTALILHVAAGDPRYANFRTIRNMLSRGADNLLELISHSSSQVALQEYAAFVNNTNEGFAKGVAQGVMQKLNPWLTPTMVTLTAQSDFTIENFKNDLFAFYVSVPGDRQDLKPVAALVLNYLMQMALSIDAKYPVTFLLDEFTNFGYIPGFVGRISLVRKTGLAFCLGFQDIAQVYNVYGRDEAPIILSQPGTRVFLRPNTLETAKHISEQLGTTTVVERTHGFSGQEQTRTKPRRLMLPEEVTTLSKDQAIVFTVATSHGLLVDKFPWQAFHDKSKIKPPQRAFHAVDPDLLNIHAITPEEARNITSKKQQRPNREARSDSRQAPPQSAAPDLSPAQMAQQLINALKNNPDNDTLQAVYQLLDQLSIYQNDLNNAAEAEQEIPVEPEPPKKTKMKSAPDPSELL